MIENSYSSRFPIQFCGFILCVTILLWVTNNLDWYSGFEFLAFGDLPTSLTAMFRNLAYVLLLAACALSTHGETFASENAPDQTPAVFVRALLDKPDDQLDFARAKLEIDHFVDPSIDIDAALSNLETMAATIERMLSTVPQDAAETSAEKLNALRAYVYEAGWWNAEKPFRYDLDDPFGQNPNAQLLTTYIETREGNCVSMPILFLILGRKLGLDMTLSTAPLHVFVKYTDDDGKTWNLEPTSGAGFTRDVWYRQKTPMTEQAIANGVYLKTLSHREALAVIATTVLDHLMSRQRYEDAIALADVLIDAYPAYAYAHVKKGSAYYRMLEAEFIRKYPNTNDIPPDKIDRANMLYQANQDAFRKAEELGWREPELN